jgi:hypothetical protein
MILPSVFIVPLKEQADTLLMRDDLDMSISVFYI